MSLVSLEFRNTRIYEHALLEPNPYLNLISGANASGKTTILEVIHLLGTGRSFRTTHTDQLRRNGSFGLSVIGKLTNEGRESVHLGLTFDPEGRRVSINGLEQRLVSQLAVHLPLQVISPDTHYEFQQNSKHRRSVLDWVLFHVEPDFRQLWARYQRILNQRNAALKNSGQSKVRHVWDEDLVDIGERLHTARANQIVKLLPHFQFCCKELLGKTNKVDLVLESGWQGDTGFGDCLRKDRARDNARGFTHSGPQRADLQIILNSQSSKLAASHGQSKILVIALRLAQIRYLVKSGSREGCLLIDDLAAELDTEHRSRLTGFLADLPIQIFITATEPTLIDRNAWSSHKEFHVEHGLISES